LLSQQIAAVTEERDFAQVAPVGSVHVSTHCWLRLSQAATDAPPPSP
jgi:hypothetical protein